MTLSQFSAMMAQELRKQAAESSELEQVPLFDDDAMPSILRASKDKRAPGPVKIDGQRLSKQGIYFV